MFARERGYYFIFSWCKMFARERGYYFIFHGVKCCCNLEFGSSFSKKKKKKKKEREKEKKKMVVHYYYNYVNSNTVGIMQGIGERRERGEERREGQGFPSENKNSSQNG